MGLYNSQTPLLLLLCLCATAEALENETKTAIIVATCAGVVLLVLLAVVVVKKLKKRKRSQHHAQEAFAPQPPDPVLLCEDNPGSAAVQGQPSEGAAVGVTHASRVLIMSDTPTIISVSSAPHLAGNTSAANAVPPQLAKYEVPNTNVMNSPMSALHESSLYQDTPGKTTEDGRVPVPSPTILAGGSYVPPSCQPRGSSAPSDKESQSVVAGGGPTHQFNTSEVFTLSIRDTSGINTTNDNTEFHRQQLRTNTLQNDSSRPFNPTSPEWHRYNLYDSYSPTNNTSMKLDDGQGLGLVWEDHVETPTNIEAFHNLMQTHPNTPNNTAAPGSGRPATCGADGLALAFQQNTNSPAMYNNTHNNNASPQPPPLNPYSSPASPGGKAYSPILGTQGSVTTTNNFGSSFVGNGVRSGTLTTLGSGGAVHKTPVFIKPRENGQPSSSDIQEVYIGLANPHLKKKIKKRRPGKRRHLPTANNNSRPSAHYHPSSSSHHHRSPSAHKGRTPAAPDVLIPFSPSNNRKSKRGPGSNTLTTTNSSARDSTAVVVGGVQQTNFGPTHNRHHQRPNSSRLGGGHTTLSPSRSPRVTKKRDRARSLTRSPIPFELPRKSVWIMESDSSNTDKGPPKFVVGAGNPLLKAQQLAQAHKATQHMMGKHLAAGSPTSPHGHMTSATTTPTSAFDGAAPVLPLSVGQLRHPLHSNVAPTQQFPSSHNSVRVTTLQPIMQVHHRRRPKGRKMRRTVPKKEAHEIRTRTSEKPKQ
eukprot:TRINITY_DN5529_c0_g1_i1.p1 TRINITY_DN5529_c0_g1~~TRINITY_DN5529_c0_g1_i1.p1  ORF type:complete len:755 (-),score=68.69 TRINITY_DN5529_c0_g1_i1:91-2355(-)